MYRLLNLVLLLALSGCAGGSEPIGAPTVPTPATEPAADPMPDPEPEPEPEPPSPPPPAPSPQIDILVVKTTSTYDVFPDPDLRIQHLVNVASDVLQDNGVDATIRIVATTQVDYPNGFDTRTALDHITFESHPSLQGVAALRETYNADLVVLFRPDVNDGLCGFAWVGGYQQNGDFSAAINAEYAFSVTVVNCGDYTLLHEAGHNMGLAHSRREDPLGGTWPYSAGYGVDNDFVTVMASTIEFSATRLPRLSSPATACNGQACGIDASDPVDGADAILTLQQTAGAVAGYR